MHEATRRLEELENQYLNLCYIYCLKKESISTYPKQYPISNEFHFENVCPLARRRLLQFYCQKTRMWG